MRLTLDEAMLLKDRFDSYVDNLIGEDVVVRRGEDEFHVEIMRKRRRTAHEDRNSGRPTTITGSHMDITSYTQRKDI